MRNLLATILFSFLMCGIANAKKIHDANENGILMTECVFSNGKCYRIAENHCAQYKKFYVHVPNHQTEKPFTVRMYCVTDFHQFFYEPIMKTQLKVYKTNYDPNFFKWVLFAALSPSIIAFLLFNFVNKKLGASITGSVLYLYTVYGAIYGFFFFDEKLEIYHLIGSIMVFIGIFMVKNNVTKI
mgnify:CR=1 FL=1